LIPDTGKDNGEIQRFSHIIVSSEGKGFNDILTLAFRRDRNDREFHRRMRLPERLEDRETADIRYHHIEDNDIEGMLADKLDCLLTTIRSHRRKPSAY
jgi:hypothetical protein